jgi:enamine deaminase RidA (YjgF/YER057c/UK114 family)
MTRTIQPEGWPRPKGYSNGMAASGEILAIAGQIGWDIREQIVSDDFVQQFDQALENVCSVVQAAGGIARQIVSLTIYVTDKHEYLARVKEVGAVYRKHLGKHFPAMALVQVVALAEDAAKVEIQGMAVL